MIWLRCGRYRCEISFIFTFARLNFTFVSKVKKHCSLLHNPRNAMKKKTELSALKIQKIRRSLYFVFYRCVTSLNRKKCCTHHMKMPQHFPLLRLRFTFMLSSNISHEYEPHTEWGSMSEMKWLRKFDRATINGKYNIDDSKFKLLLFHSNNFRFDHSVVSLFRCFVLTCRYCCFHFAVNSLISDEHM